MLRWRLLLGAIFIAALVMLFWLDMQAAKPGIVLFPLAALITPFAAGEMLRLTTVREQRPIAWVVYVGSVLVVVASGVPHFWPDYPQNCPLGLIGWPTIGLAVAVLLAILGEIARYDESNGATKNLALAVWSIIYVGLLISFMIQLRFVGGEAWSALPLISLLIVVKFCDIGAYTVGRLIGRHKLAPRLSPGKTIEGLIGGLAFACIASWLFFAVLVPQIGDDLPIQSSSSVLLYGLLIGAAGAVGDLAESLLKRDAGYKDSSAWMPGFGGVLDLLDSPLFAAPVAYVLWSLNLFSSG